MKLNIFQSTAFDGIMSKKKEYYKNLTSEEIDTIYNINVGRFLDKYNLKVEDAIVYTDKNNKKSAHTVVKGNNKLKDRILILKENTPNIPVLVETNDDPILVGYAKDEEDKTTVAIALATIENLNNDLIRDMTTKLMEETNAPTFEMTFYVGPCPSKESYVVDKNLLTNKIFEGKTEEIDGKTYLDIRYTIFDELYKEIVAPESIYFDSNDTVTSNKYYSKIGNKKGMQVACVVFTDEEV